MAAQLFSQVVFPEPAPESAPRRSSHPVYSVKRNKNNTTPGGCCSGGGHHGCGCGCEGCLCRLENFKDQSNCEAYPGEGGREFAPRPYVDLPNRASSFGSSSASVRTDDSRLLSDGSFNSSFEEHGHFHGHHTASDNITGAGNQFMRSEAEEDGHYAWSQFITRANNFAHTSHEEGDSSGMVIPGLEMDDSTLATRGSDVHYDQRSVLSIDYESSFMQPSATASQVLTGTGAHLFLVRPLRLTPECRHSINNSICARCVH